MCVHRHNSENIFKVFLLVLHLIPKVGLYSLSCHKFSAILVSRNHKMFKEKKNADANPVIFSVGDELRPIGPALPDEWATRRRFLEAPSAGRHGLPRRA